ncbi:MAG: ATP-binding protein [Bacteroidota bacterium]|jgi:serine/threonine-protein kinase RsbW
MFSSKIISENLLCARSELTELSKIRDFVRSQAENFGFNDDDVNKIILAVDEACTNLIKYAYKFDNSKEFCVLVETDFNIFTINIHDSGAPFNPLDVMQPDMTDYMKKFKRGGLGIHIMRTVMDEIVYCPSSESCPKNILKLKKYLHSYQPTH